MPNPETERRILTKLKNKLKSIAQHLLLLEHQLNIVFREIGAIVLELREIWLLTTSNSLMQMLSGKGGVAHVVVLF